MHIIHKISVLALFMLFCISGWSQNKEIKGTVINHKGEPVSGALVSVVDHPELKAYTDTDGTFQIFTSVENSLKIETVDDGVKTIQLDSSEEAVTVLMDFASQRRDMGFGFDQPLSESTGAISYTSSEDVNKRSSFSTANSLFGNVLGLTALQNSGAVWDAAATMYIRGLQTTSSNSILVLVDGIERDIRYIVPEEVASVSVLRDAAAVALYGYKGINGILSVTTKRGKYKTSEINVSYDHAINWQTRKPKFVDGFTYAKAINEALTNDGQDTRYSQDDLNGFESGDYPYLYPNVDWVDEVFRDHGSSNIYNVNFRGGGEKMRYFTMFNLQGNQGFIRNSEMNEGYSTQEKYSKANIRTNLDIDVTSTTTAEINLMGVLNEFSRPGLSSDSLMGKLYTVPSAAFPIKTSDGIWGGNETWGANMNPVALTQARGYSTGHTRSLYADFKLSQKLDVITEGLSASLRLGYDNIAAYWEGHNRDYAYASDVVTSWENGEPAEISRYSAGADSELGYGDKLDWQDRHMNFIGSVDYETSFEKSKLLTSLIYSYENHVLNNQNNTYYRQNVAAYAHYVYNSKYIADLTLVASGSNKLAPGQKWNYSPTVSAAWVMSKEDFMSSANFIDFLKLRASFGIINSDNIPAEDYWEQSFSDGGGYYLGGNYDWYGGTMEGQLASMNSTNEKAFKYNFGVDASMFKGLNVTVDTYYEKRKDIWVSAGGANSAVLGASSPYANGGIVNSWGLETGLDYNKQIGDLAISLGGKFTLSKNEIEEMLEEPRAYDYLRRTGQSVSQIFGYQALGFFIDEADIANSPAQQFSEVQPGDIKYKDQNGDGIINEYDEIALGYNNVVPEIYYSFNLGLEWKGFGVSALFQGASNYTAILNTQSIYRPLINNTNISEYYYDNRWTQETPFSRFPRLTTESNANNTKTSSVWLADASYLKLRNCEVYYKLPVNFLSKIKMKSGKVYVRGVDLLSFDNIDISDPESIGVAYPMTRSLNVGFAFGF
ncbi:SusC/RagA family TonB-linked outer membrane protein [Mangrovibacterium lignilyticum]|uniref:SusC/RagA family TonB-linked outer membrane protein n=1 Tax=Mangrovibacterium lignilyticum TaxID=2668052 RepID=UPI0019684854|nr:SusC/RagA family TonB-linked outer membrane protein [Mangrovibacterium lignilyticum]